MTSAERQEIVGGLSAAGFKTTAIGLLVLALTFVRSAAARKAVLEESSAVFQTPHRAPRAGPNHE